MRRRQSRAKSRADCIYIPDEIVIEILVRLPVKSILKFMCVCRSWYSIINNPSFITTHLNHQTTNNKKNYHLLRYRSQFHSNRPNGCVSIRRDDDYFSEYFEPNFPVQLNSLRVYGCCNGLVCVSENYLLLNRTIFLWNPALRKLKTLPSSQIYCAPHSESDINCSVFLAFGFLPMLDDYKVVRIVDFNEGKLAEVEVYNLSTDSWRKIGVAPSCYIIGRPPVFMNGVAYWIAFRKTEEGVMYFLLAFDMNDEVFREVMLPESIQRIYPIITGSGGSLYLFHYCVSGADEIESCDIWVLELSITGFWEKRYTTAIQDIVGRDFIGMQPSFRKDGELLLVSRHSHMVSYNLETELAKDLGIYGCSKAFCAHPYIESLVLFAGGNQLSVLANSCAEAVLTESPQEADGRVEQHEVRKLKVSKERKRKKR